MVRESERCFSGLPSSPVDINKKELISNKQQYTRGRGASSHIASETFVWKQTQIIVFSANRHKKVRHKNETKIPS